MLSWYGIPDRVVHFCRLSRTPCTREANWWGNNFAKASYTGRQMELIKDSCIFGNSSRFSRFIMSCAKNGLSILWLISSDNTHNRLNFQLCLLYVSLLEKLTCHQLGNNLLHFPVNVIKCFRNESDQVWLFPYHGFVMAAISQAVMSIERSRERCISLFHSIASLLTSPKKASRLRK